MTMKIDNAKAPSVKGADSKMAEPILEGNKKAEIIITEAMKKCIGEAKKLMEEGNTKADAAREVFDKLKGHERKQIIYAFIEGCGLTKAGAGTYFQNIKKKME